MTFGQAIEALKIGNNVTRAGWNGKGMFLFLAQTVSIFVLEGILDARMNLPIGPSVCMKTAQDTIVVGWLASQTDMLAEDWLVVPYDG